MDIDRHTFPPGGWRWFQPQTAWWAPAPISMTFDQQVTNIIKHRLANKAVTIKYHLATDFPMVADELENYTRLRLGLPPLATNLPKPMPRPSPISQSVGAAVEGVKRLAAGAALLFEWEESGQPPVAPELAAKRAAICVVCPKNDPQHLSKYFTSAVSEMLRRKLARLHSMNMTTPSDPQLGICNVCLCPLKLKTHSPLDLILKHTNAQTMSEFPDHCWVKKRDQ